MCVQNVWIQFFYHFSKPHEHGDWIQHFLRRQRDNPDIQPLKVLPAGIFLFRHHGYQANPKSVEVHVLDNVVQDVGRSFIA